MSIQLFGDRVLIEAESNETDVGNGLVITADEGPSDMRYGVVKEVGCGIVLEDGTLRPMDLARGDRVMFQYGTDVIIEGVSYVLVNGGDVILSLD